MRQRSYGRGFGLLGVVLGLVIATPGVTAAESAKCDVARAWLPWVTACNQDSTAHINRLSGALCDPRGEPPSDAALRFLEVHQGLYPRARGTVFSVEKVSTPSSSPSIAIVELVQEIDGFRPEDSALSVSITSAGVVRKIVGTVLNDEDVPPATGPLLSFDAAEKMATKECAEAGQLIRSSAKGVIGGEKLSRMIHTSQIYQGGKGSTGYTSCDVRFYAETGAIHDVRIVPVTGLIEEQLENPTVPPSGDVISSCATSTIRVGDFETLQGQLAWTPTRVGEWSFDGAMSELRANDLEYACVADPRHPSHHGAISLSNVTLPPGVNKARIAFGASKSCSSSDTITFRWGPTSSEAVPISGAQVCGVGDAIVDLELSQFATWDSFSARNLTLEVDCGGEFHLQYLDLIPGPWLEFGQEPEVTPSFGNSYYAGWPLHLEQEVVNLGCDLERPPIGTCSVVPPSRGPGHDPYAAMRQLEVRGQKMIPAPGGGWEPDPSSPSEVLCSSRICRAIGGGERVDVSPCQVGQGLPDEPGHWRLDVGFPSHDVPITSVEIDVDPAPHPDISVNRQVPVELVPLLPVGVPGYRYDTLEPNACALAAIQFSTGVVTGGGPAPSSAVSTYLRIHDPTAPIGECPSGSESWVPVQDTPTTSTLYSDSDQLVAIDSAACDILMSQIDDWQLLDLWIHLGPAAGELDTTDNDYCIQAWLPIADGFPFVDVVGGAGSALVDGDYQNNCNPDPGPAFESDLDYTPNCQMNGYSDESAAAMQARGPDPKIIFAVTDPSNPTTDMVGGLMIRYRRQEPGMGQIPFLAAAADEEPTTAQVCNGGDISWDGSSHQPLLTDNQWQVVAWRRGDLDPLGDFPGSAIFASDADLHSDGSDHALGVLLKPDTNFLPASNEYPITYIDFIRVWKTPRPLIQSAEFEVANVVRNLDGFWVTLGGSIEYTGPMALAVSVTNSGTVAGSATIDAAVDINGDVGKSIVTLTGTDTLTLGPGQEGFIPVAPSWDPSPGVFSVHGRATVNGSSIGSHNASVFSYTPSELQIARAEYHVEPGGPDDWAPLVLGTELPVYTDFPLRVIVTNSGSLLATGELICTATSASQTTPTFHQGVSIASGSDTDPFEYQVGLDPPWQSPGPGQTDLHVSCAFDGTPIGDMVIPLTIGGCETPAVYLP